MMNNPTITFIACSHNENKWNRCFVQSMLSQTCKNFEAVIINNGHSSEMKEYVSKLPNLRYEESNIDSGNWGTANRQKAINECPTEYIIQSSIQDYWLSQTVDYIIKGLESKPDILIWNSINHIVEPCKELNAELAWSKLDWGNFAIRTDIAKQIPIKQTEYCADWLFIQDAINKKLIKTVKKLPYILTIHN